MFKPRVTALCKPTAAARTASTRDTRAAHAKTAFHLALEAGSPGTRLFTWISRAQMGLRHLPVAPGGCTSYSFSNQGVVGKAIGRQIDTTHLSEQR